MSKLEQRGLLLAFDATACYATAEVALNAGDRIVFYSDGLVEACGAGDECFGDQRLGQLLVAGTIGEPEQFVGLIVAELQRWIGPDTPLQDDVTVVVVDVTL